MAVPPAKDQARIVHLDVDRRVVSKAVPEEAEIEGLRVHRKEESLDGETGLVGVLWPRGCVSVKAQIYAEEL